MTDGQRQELRRLLPELSGKELKETGEALDRYVRLVARIVERRHYERKEEDDKNGVK